MGKEATSASRTAAPDPAAKPRRLFLKQANMRRMLYALAPLAIAGVYFFGWRALALLAACNLAGLITEFITSRQRGQPISTACLVTCWLLSLSLPPQCPMWVAVIASVVAILFGKEVFGGFGRNFANPAIVGRAFVYVCFPTPLTAEFTPVFKGLPGGFAHWSMAGLQKLPDYLASSGRSVADAITQASPMWVGKTYGAKVASQGASLWDLVTGSIGGVFQAEGKMRVLSGGSIGEGCAILIVLAAVYLLITRTASWRLMLSCLLGLVTATLVFRNLLGYDGSDPSLPARLIVPPIPFMLLAGSTLYVTVFMVTEPVSAPTRRLAQLAYGFFTGVLIVFLRWRGVFVEATSFAVLLANIVAPMLDLGADRLGGPKKAPAKPVQPQAAEGGRA